MLTSPVLDITQSAIQAWIASAQPSTIISTVINQTNGTVVFIYT